MTLGQKPGHFGRYRLLSRLARGGMGEVFVAAETTEAGGERRVVIKRILPHLADDTDFVHMFLDEAKIAARLHHPNVVQIYDLGQVGSYFYLAMEFIPGADLRHVLKRAHDLGRPFPPQLACRVIAQAAEGLDYAHGMADDRGEPLGIVHRDVSPQNILVTPDGGVKVIDFGIARARGRLTQTLTGSIKGRFEYMSPEHAGGLEVDRRSDVFALGVVLWETLTGTRLFKRASDTKTLFAVSECLVQAPSELNPAVPRELDAIILKALARVPRERFQDAGQFKVALEGWGASSGRSGTAADLGAFMGELYAEGVVVPKAPVAAAAEEPSAGRPVSMPARPPPSVPAAARPAEPSAARPQPPPPKRALEGHATVIECLPAGGATSAVAALEGAKEAAARPRTFASTANASRLARRHRVRLVAFGAVVLGILGGATLAVLRPSGAGEGVEGPDDGEAGPDAGGATGHRGRRGASRAAAAPRSRCPAGMVLVAGAMFPFGESTADRSKVLITIPDACIDRYEFPDAEGRMPQLVGDPTEAAGLCAAAGKRLCTEEEWEHACKGPDDLPLPYGRRPDPTACNTAEPDGRARVVATAGAYARCASGFGAMDMVGNVAEWTSAALEPKALARRKGGGTGDAGGCSVRAAADRGGTGLRCCADPAPP